MTEGGSRIEEKHQPPTRDTGHASVGWFCNNNSNLCSCPVQRTLLLLWHNVSETNCPRCPDIFQKAAEEARFAARTRSIVHLLQAFPGWARKIPERPRCCQSFTKMSQGLCAEHSLTSAWIFYTWQVRPESGRLPIIHHSGYVCDLPANHRFPMGKFPRVLHFLLKDQVVEEGQVGALSPAAAVRRRKLIKCSCRVIHLRIPLTNNSPIVGVAVHGIVQQCKTATCC